MKTLYIECNMGAAGDMLTAALLELLPEPDAFVARMNDAGIPGMVMARSEKVSRGLRGTHISVCIDGEEEISDDVPEDDHEHHHEHEHAHGHDHHHDHHHEHAHSHAGLADVAQIIHGLKLPEEVKRDALGVYELIAQAEAHAHGCAVEHIHFHEVGMMDAIADVSAVCLLMHLIAPERVIVSPVCTGFGEVRCMHGVVPVPAPATAHLLRGMPAYAGSIRGELLTPTGAALLKYFATEYGRMPAMRIERVGSGMGMKEFEAANCVRVFLGEDGADSDEVAELSCNLDDMTGEMIGCATEILLEAGALDVYLTAIQMKKNRPGVKLSCICRPEDVQRMTELMLKHTTTLGVRTQRFARTVLNRSREVAHTVYGDVEIKLASGAGIEKRKPEYESALRVARANDVPLAEVLRAAMQDK